MLSVIVILPLSVHVCPEMTRFVDACQFVRKVILTLLRRECWRFARKRFTAARGWRLALEMEADPEELAERPVGSEMNAVIEAWHASRGIEAPG